MAPCWLLKAEPNTRLERGVDVSFSVDEFERVNITSWEGVRNHVAKKMLKEKMKLGEKCLFYHSSCPNPGIAAFATVVKEGYPDHNAFDPAHPYFDPKSDQTKPPVWYMVDLEFVARLDHFVSLKFLQTLAAEEEVPDCVSYISKEQLEGIKKMTLLSRGRLSVQPVEQLVYDAIELLGTKGGFESLLVVKKVRSPKKPKQEVTVEDDQGEVEEKVEIADLDIKGEEFKPQVETVVKVVVKRKKEAKEKVVASGNRASKRLKKEVTN